MFISGACHEFERSMFAPIPRIMGEREKELFLGWHNTKVQSLNSSSIMVAVMVIYHNMMCLFLFSFSLCKIRSHMVAILSTRQSRNLIIVELYLNSCSGQSR